MAAQTFGEMRAELVARGFAYLDTTRLNRFINEAYMELCELEAWPFVEKTSSSAAPITFTDMRQVLSVTDTINLTMLGPSDRRTLAMTGDLTTAGTPAWWYFEGDVMKVYPVATNTLSVRYLYVPALLSADADFPVVPDRFVYMILDGAAIKAYKDSDNFQNAASLRQEYDRGVAQMRETLLERNLDDPYVIVSVGDHTDA
jgi:hypothetical protein